jgi:hypothetical protein
MIHPHHIEQDRDLASVMGLVIKPVEKSLPGLLCHVFSLVVLVANDRIEFTLIEFIQELDHHVIELLSILKELREIRLDFISPGFLLEREEFAVV